MSTRILLPGMDLSVANDSTQTHADDIDFDKIVEAGKVFIPFKATEGITYQDPQFRYFIAAAQARPLAVTAYEYFHPRQDVQKQLENFLRATDSIPLDFPPWLDVETMDENKKAGILPVDGNLVLDGVQTWLEGYKKERGKVVTIYTGFYYWEALGKRAADEYWAQYDLAIAAYVKEDQLKIPAAWKEKGWTFWQYSGNSTCPGVATPVDLDWFNGSLVQFEYWRATGNRIENE